MFIMNAVHLDTIERIRCFKDALMSVDKLSKTLEYDLEDTPVNEVRDLLNTFENCRFTDNFLIIERCLTEEEKDKECTRYKNIIKYNTKKLSEWMHKSEKNKISILGYLERHNITIENLK